MNDLFLGYDEDFYDAIPWVAIDGGDTPAYESEYAIDPSFTAIAAKLLFRKNNEKVYREYGLPEDDAVKAAVLDSPELLFYAPASRTFPVSQLFASGGQSIGVSASTSFLPINIQD